MLAWQSLINQREALRTFVQHCSPLIVALLDWIVRHVLLLGGAAEKRAEEGDSWHRPKRGGARGWRQNSLAGCVEAGGMKCGVGEGVDGSDYGGEGREAHGW